MRAMALSICLLIAAGCGDDPVVTTAGAGGAASSSSSSGTTNTGGGAAAGGQAAQGGAGGSGGAGGQLLVLSDRGLLTRYFIDEAGSGQGPTQLEDAAPDPLAMPSLYTPELSFTEVDGHRGLAWTATSNDGRPQVVIQGTKVATRLEGTTEATAEVVVRVTSYSSSNSRFSSIAFGSDYGGLTFGTDTTNEVWASFNVANTATANVEYYSASLPSTRMVMHYIYESTKMAGVDRRRIYVNGVRLTSKKQATDPLPGEVLTFQANQEYTLGNREAGQRSFNGELYYAALYDVALNNEEIVRHAKLLFDDDDSPQ
jgi:hypothetical protein